MSNLNYESELKQVIALLYETFANYPLNPQITGCPCCVTESDNQLIKSKVLSQLTANDLDRFALKAIYTWGTIEDFKHFLPRLLELIAFEHHFFWSGTVISKLAYAGFKNWDEQERKAVNKYLITLWNYILSQYPNSSIELSEFIDRLMDITDDLHPFLLIWQNHPSINSLLHLSDFIANEIEFNKSPIKIIHLSQENTVKFLHWLTRREMIEKLEQSFFDSVDKSYADKLAIAIDILNAV